MEYEVGSARVEICMILRQTVPCLISVVLTQPHQGSVNLYSVHISRMHAKHLILPHTTTIILRHPREKTRCSFSFPVKCSYLVVDADIRKSHCGSARFSGEHPPKCDADGP